MIKRTLYFSKPAYFHIKNNQLIYEPKTGDEIRTFPVEDLGFVVFDNPQITFSSSVVEALNQNNTALIFCDLKHIPKAMLLNLDSNNLQNEIFHHQINAKLPLKKKLWQQTVKAKIENQYRLLKKYGRDYYKVKAYKDEVLSGDRTNREAMASKEYWKNLFNDRDFKRDRNGKYPNNLLNYGYAILRAAVARSLAGSGLLPTLGIHHHNRYNAFCLADDIMEPFRPYIDECVLNIVNENSEIYDDLNMEIKSKLLSVLTVDTKYPETRRPLMIGLQQTTASLARCFEGIDKEIIYPVME